jgi:hypothetical protein
MRMISHEEHQHRGEVVDTYMEREMQTAGTTHDEIERRMKRPFLGKAGSRGGSWKHMGPHDTHDHENAVV